MVGVVEHFCEQLFLSVGATNILDVETAAAALHLVNGYQFKGKPIIIQYGRKE